MDLVDIIDTETYRISDPTFRVECKTRFDREGILEMPGFVRAEAVEAIRAEGVENQDKIFAKSEEHTVYLKLQDSDFPPNHPRNRLVVSSKGCITDDLIPHNSALRAIYDSAEFREFLCDVLGETALYEYADPLSSINLHFAKTGQELGWHFDNSSFAITLMIQAPELGGQFEYVTNVRDADAGDMGYDAIDGILDESAKVQQLSANAGTLILFRGRNSIHRVAPNEGQQARILAVLAYNSEPGISLSEAARMTFYGRTE